MVPAVIIVLLLLAFAGRSASQEQDCSKTVLCYEKLRKETVRNVDALPGPEPTSAKLASYKRFCEYSAPSPSPCSRFEDFKECLKRPEMEAHEKVYNELRGFVCDGYNATWTRFMGILFSKTNDSCKNALDATKQVLKGDLDKCGMVEQLFDECASQRHLPTDVLEPGMELLGCRREQPVIPRRSASQEQDCSKTVLCYEKLRKETVRNVDALPGPEPTSAKLASYKRFCEYSAPSPSPCSRFEDFKECLKRPEMEAREKVYNELRGFVCDGYNATWTRFMGILFSKTNDSCKGALDATKQVLKGDLDKCGMVEQLFDECASQRHLPTDVLEPGMELLGCRQEQPIIPTTQPAPHPPASSHGEGQQCDKDDAIRCLKMSARRLETSMGFKNSGSVVEQDGCTPLPPSCLAPHRLQGCSDSDSMQLSVLEAAIEAVRSAACGNDRALLQNIRRTAACLNVEEFKRCADESRIDISKTMFTKQECSASFSSVNECIEKSRKLCEPDVDSARKLSSAFFSVYGCDPKQHQLPKHEGPNSGASLASSVTLTLSVALVASIATRR